MSHRVAKATRAKLRETVKKSTTAEELLGYFRKQREGWAKFDQMFWENMYEMMEKLEAEYRDKWTGEGYYDPD